MRGDRLPDTCGNAKKKSPRRERRGDLAKGHRTAESVVIPRRAERETLLIPDLFPARRVHLSLSFLARFLVVAVFLDVGKNACALACLCKAPERLFKWLIFFENNAVHE